MCGCESFWSQSYTYICVIVDVFFWSQSCTYICVVVDPFGVIHIPVYVVVNPLVLDALGVSHILTYESL